MSSWGLLGELWCSRARSVDLGVYTLIISLGTARWLSRVAYLCSLAHSARGLPLPPLLLTLGVLSHCIFVGLIFVKWYAAAAAKSLQSCLTLCNPIDGSPPGSPVPGILQASTLEWVAISFSSAWKWKVKVKLRSHVRLLATLWTAACQASLSITNSQSLPKLMSIESVMPSNHLIL